MAFRRRLIPLVVAVLVVQGLVAVVPHQHRTPPVDGQDARVPFSNAVVHDCFACSIHAPAVDLAAAFGVATGSAVAPLIAVGRGSRITLPVLSPSSPRGPPVVV